MRRCFMWIYYGPDMAGHLKAFCTSSHSFHIMTPSYNTAACTSQYRLRHKDSHHSADPGFESTFLWLQNLSTNHAANLAHLQLTEETGHTRNVQVKKGQTWETTRKIGFNVWTSLDSRYIVHTRACWDNGDISDNEKMALFTHRFFRENPSAVL